MSTSRPAQGGAAPDEAACLDDPDSNVTAICVWRIGYERALVVAEQAVARGRAPYFVRCVATAYPTNDAWQRLNALGSAILTVSNDVGGDDVESAVVLAAVRVALRRREVSRAMAAAAPKATALPDDQRPPRSTEQRTPAERTELLRAVYSTQTDEGVR